MDAARAIEPELTPGFPPVTILEGPRTCGKTFVARKLVSRGLWQRYENLADPDTLELAKHDLVGWLRSLPDTTIIDEAQLIDQLPLQIKRLVDEASSPRRFLLTGSARIGRAGLGGIDPLTGRTRRWMLSPLTLAELDGRAADMATLAERLFSGAVLDAHAEQSFDVVDHLNRGGFPLISLTPHTLKTVDQWVRDTTIGLLTDAVLPDDRFDAGLALRVLDGCLRDPAGILNVASLGQRLAINPRTIDRYLDILERRFLLHFLPNLATNPTRQTRARSKVHPVDTAFAAESLRRSDSATLTSPRIVGDLFESYVINQVVPCLQFSDSPVHAYYWRESRSDREVDLVVADTENRRVGIEVKSSAQVSLADARNLHALDQSMGLTMAYVVYAGSKTVRLADRCWALPVTAL